MDTLHKHIIGRAVGSSPEGDLRQLGFDPDELFTEIATNPLMTFGMLDASDGNLAKYAMTWLSIGITLMKEKDAAGPDSFPATPDE